jgi:large subunit ribosomal protein L29
MKQRDINNKTTAELEHLLEELRAKMLQMRFDLADKKLKDTSQVQKARRDIARIMTALNH